MINFKTTSEPITVERIHKWNPADDQQLRNGIEEFGEGSWTTIALQIPGRTAIQCYNRWMKTLRPNLVKRTKWTEEEDKALTKWVDENGPRKWSRCGLAGRNEKQCRERWINVLSSEKKRAWTVGEDRQIMSFYITQGPRWHVLSQLLPGRSSDSLKNRLNSNLRKMIHAKTAKKKISVVDFVKRDDDVIGRYEIVMTYEEYIRRKANSAMLITDFALNEAAELILKSKVLK